FSPLAHLRNLATPHVSYRLCRAVGASPTAQAGVAEEMEKLPGLWQQAAAGRRRHRAGLLRGVPARQARPPRPTGLRSHEARRAPANVGRCYARRRARSSLWREGDGSSGERPSFKGRAGQGRDADAARWRSLGQTAVRCHTCGTTQRAN
ncbi:unnamed protein product, partial [Prorocentrum cordatum]